MTDLIKQVGGIEKAREALSLCCWMDGSFCTRLWLGCIKNDHDCCVDVDDLRQAIADYNTDHCSDIINHVSPSTQVYEK